MKLSDLNKRQRKVMEKFRMEPIKEKYLIGVAGVGKVTMQSLVDLDLLEYSEEKWGYRLTENGLKLLN